MVTQDLLNFISYQKQRGISDENIRKQLLESSWPESDVAQGFLQYNSSSTHAPAPIPVKIPTIVKVISILIFIISFGYVTGGIIIFAIGLIMEKAMNGQGSVSQTFENFPLLIILPLVCFVCSSFFVYIGIKVRGASRRSFWIALVGLAAIPLTLATLFQGFINSFSKLSVAMDPAQPRQQFSTLRYSAYGNPFFLLALATTVVLLVSYRKFNLTGNAISKRSKIFITVFAFMFCMPALLFAGSEYLKSKDTDIGYSNVSSHVNYSVYRLKDPSSLGLSYAARFMGERDLAGIKNAIRVAYDVPLTQLSNSEKGKLTVIEQVGVPATFNLETYVDTLVKSNTKKEIVTLPIARGGKAYLIQSLSALNLFRVVFVTNDNVLIVVASPHLSREEIIMVASALTTGK